MIHRLAHFFGWNTGCSEVWTARCGRLMGGFRCDKCHKLTNIHPLPRSFNRKANHNL